MATEVGQMQIRGTRVTVLHDEAHVILRVKKGWIKKTFRLTPEKAEALVEFVTQAAEAVKTKGGDETCG